MTLLRAVESDADDWIECLEAADRRVQMSAIRVVTREESPDHYGLGLEPAEAPRRRVHSGMSVARQSPREPDPESYEDAWTRPIRRH